MLRGLNKFISLFLSPDHSFVQRTQQTDLINDLKRLNLAEPDKKHFLLLKVVKYAALPKLSTLLCVISM